MIHPDLNITPRVPNSPAATPAPSTTPPMPPAHRVASDPNTTSPAQPSRRGPLHLDRSSLAIAVAFLLLLTALFLPPINTIRATYDYLVVFDITQSMNVEDYELSGTPVSRLTFAREAVRRTLRELPCGSRVGWGVFAEYRTLVLLAPIEVCENYNDLLASLDRIDGRMRWANASEISKGVFWALRGARDVGGHPKVLFLTDGQEAPPVEGEGLPLFDDLKRGEIGGWLIGVGGYTPRPIPRTDADGRPMGFWHSDEVVQRQEPARGAAASHEHLSEVREPYLRHLAREVGFEYLHLAGAQSIHDAMLQPRFADRRKVPTDFAWLAATAALATLFFAFTRVVPRRLSYTIRFNFKKPS
jgi:mxaL protein